MKRCLVLLVCYFAFVLSLNAQQIGADAPASKEDVERYMGTIHAHDMMMQVMQAMSKPMHEMVHRQFVKDQDRLPPDFEARMTRIMDDMLTDLPLDDMTKAMVPIYQKHFTHGDIESLIAFYSAPVGQKLLHETPAITGETMQSIMPIMQSRMAQMQQRIQQEVAESLKSSQK